jgi:hypothetical protein
MALDEEKTSGGDLDARLLNKRGSEESSSDRVGALREAKRNSQNNEIDNTPNYLEEEPTSLRQAVIQKKRKEDLEIKQGGISEALKKKSPIRKGTSSLLRAAWINLIDSFGLTLIWINIHVFLNKVLGDGMFCRLGEEWTDRPGVSSSMAKGEIDKKARNSVGLVEKMGLGCLNLGCLIIFIAIFVVIALVLKFFENPLDFFAELIGFVWDATKNAIVNFFSGS